MTMYVCIYISNIDFDFEFVCSNHPSRRSLQVVEMQHNLSYMSTLELVL